MSLGASIDKGRSMAGQTEGGVTSSLSIAGVEESLERHDAVKEGAYVPDPDIARPPKMVERPTKVELCKIASVKRSEGNTPKGEQWTPDIYIRENDFQTGQGNVTANFKTASEALRGSTLARDKETLSKLDAINLATNTIIGITEVGMLVNDLAYKFMEQMLVTREARDEKEKRKNESDVARSELMNMKTLIQKANLATSELTKLKGERDTALLEAKRAMDELARTKRDMEILKKQLAESKSAIRNCEELLRKSKEEVISHSRTSLSAEQEEDVVQRFLNSPRFVCNVERYAAPSFLYGFRVCRAQARRMLKLSGTPNDMLDGLDLQEICGEGEPQVDPCGFTGEG